MSIMLEFLFIGGDTPECLDAVDVNDDGVLTLSDPLYLLEFLFTLAPEPLPPFQTAGLDPTPTDPFGCLNLAP